MSKSVMGVRLREKTEDVKTFRVYHIGLNGKRIRLIGTIQAFTLKAARHEAKRRWPDHTWEIV